MPTLLILTVTKWKSGTSEVPNRLLQPTGAAVPVSGTSQLTGAADPAAERGRYASRNVAMMQVH
jgi:hypothetical protein